MVGTGLDVPPRLGNSMGGTSTESSPPSAITSAGAPGGNGTARTAAGVCEIAGSCGIGVWGTVMVSGKVIRFDEVRGYGFVVPDHGGEDVFVHVNDLEFDKGLMAPGVKVEFVVDEGDRGPKASNVRFLEGAPGRSGGLHRSQSALSGGPFEDGVLCDTLSAQEFLDEVTELLVTGVPSMTGEQILQARQRLLKQAQSHEWVDA